VTLFRTLILLVATMTMGLTAGVFVLYAHTIMPGLRGTDDRTFVTAFQALDRAIINPWFMVFGFVGALLSTAVAVFLRPHPVTIAALVLYLVAVVVTVAVHLPLNDAIKAAGGTADVATVRAQFDEARWTAWNLVRVATSVAAFACLAWALVLEGRATAA
jgi:uncharacterized membrane protein